MQIFIDIPEEIYKDIVKNGFIYDEDNEIVTHVIKNGTPLPEHHGYADGYEDGYAEGYADGYMAMDT